MGIVRGKRIDDKDQSDAEYRRQNVFGYVQNGVRTLFIVGVSTGLNVFGYVQNGVRTLFGFVCHFG